MSVPKLPPDLLHRAAEIYVAHAYPAGPPASVRGKLETLRSLGEGELLSSPLFERDKRLGASKVCVRLGNRFYPHMKLTIEVSPDGSKYLFRADTHDRHCAPAPGSRECEAFAQLMQKNQAIAQEIEAAWAEAGVPTFKTYLRDDLVRRRATERG